MNEQANGTQRQPTEALTTEALKSQDPWQTDEVLAEDFKPMSAEQAQNWRRANPAVSPWRVVAWQAIVGVVFAAALGAVIGSVSAAWSAAYGAVSVVLPGAVFARGLMRQMRHQAHGGSAFAGLMVWELAKIVLTIAMLLLAQVVVPGLNWLALLAGFVVTMKVVWVAVWLRPKAGSSA